MRNIFILIGLVTSAGVNAQTVLNGSFENHIYSSCTINESNTSYSSSMLNSSAFGSHNTVDVLDSLCYGTAQDGNWFIWLGTAHIPGTFDAISLEMSSPLVVGNNYHISYYDTGDSTALALDFGPEILEIGVSTNDTTFGTLVYTSPFPITSNWTQRSFTFIASDTAKFITVRAIPSTWPANGGGTQIDNFSITLTTTGVSSTSSEYKIKLYPNPATELINIELGGVNSYRKVQIINLYGQVVLEEGFNNSQDLAINISKLTSGFYFVAIDIENKIVTQKFIKK